MKFPLIGATGEERADDVSYQMTKNLYLHSPSDGKSPAVLYSTPGQTVFSSVGKGPIRGMITFGNYIWVASGSEFYRVNSTGTATLIGSLNTNSGKVCMAHNGANNGKQIILTDGNTGYIYDDTYATFGELGQISTGTADTNTANKLVDTSATFVTDGVVAGMVVYNTTDNTQCIVGAVDSETSLSLVDANGTATDTFPDGNETYEVGSDAYPSTAESVAFMDGYFIVNDPDNSGRFYISAGYQGYDWDALDFATAERSPDELDRVIASNRILWLVGERTTELWYNSGNASFPFEPMQSGFMQQGTIAPESVVEISGTLMLLTQNEEGGNMVVAMTNTQPEIVSTPEIAAMISGYTTTNAYAWSYQHQQHLFYVLTFPNDGVTLVYDLYTKQWHQWENSQKGYHRSYCHEYTFGGNHYVGDPDSNEIYVLDWDTYTDNGDFISRVRRSKNIHADGVGVRHFAVQVDIKEGVGDATTTDPQIGLRWRDDNGAWSNYYFRSMGEVGEHDKRVIWRRLGRSYDRVYEIRVTDPVNVVIIDAFATITPDSQGHI